MLRPLLQPSSQGSPEDHGSTSTTTAAGVRYAGVRAVMAPKNSMQSWVVAAAGWLLVCCSHESQPAAGGAQPVSTPPVSQPVAAKLPTASGKACIVLLHGKGGHALPERVTGDTTYLLPGGNTDGWGGRYWLYYPEQRYQEVRAIVQRAIDDAGCGPVIVQGFSNGAAAAAKLYCRAERFNQHVIGYIVDDPVPDHGADGCKPAAGVQLRLYWTGGLSVATAGWSCAEQDWTCEGGSTIGIERYGRALATEVKPSIHSTHAEYASPPEQTLWFAR
jgi:pimeloyl-ACP methyl ester carboxylesterase